MTTSPIPPLSSVKQLLGELDEVYHSVATLTVDLERARESLTAVNEHLEAEVGKRTEHLRAALLEADRANRAKTDFLATMSHEIRTPMNGVVGMVELLLLSSLDGQQQQMAQTIHDSAKLLLHIINDILDFSKIEAGKIELETAEFDLNELVDSVVKLLRPKADEQGLQLSIYIDPQINGPIRGDLYRTRQILFNLAGNAIKFTPKRDDGPGCVAIRISCLSDRDEATALLKFDVIDNGIGIAESKLEHLFDRFYQTEQSTTRRFGGSGLGLAICQGLAELMGGEITVTSKYGEGSCFSVILPFELPKKGGAQQSPLAGVKVGIILSDSQLRQDIAEYLGYWQAQVTLIDCPPSHIGSWLKNVETKILIFDQQEHSMLAALIPDHVRLVVLSSDRNETKGLITPRTVAIDNYPLNRARLILAVAICAGRESPEQLPASEEALTGLPVRKAPTVEEAIRQGRLILVAEDNKHNQTVLKMQLAQLGYIAEFFDDGVEALSAWQSGRYGLIMTDCHMPNMDGYELTRQIRKLEKKGHNTIIAITANALRGEAQRCLGAGMDDYITKPATLAKLAQLLDKWLPLDESANSQIDAQSSSGDSVASDESVALLNLSTLNEIIGEDQDMQRNILTQFLQILIECQEQIQSSYSKAMWSELEFLSHRLKSSAVSCGALRLSDCCEQLEHAGEKPDKAQLAELYERFQKTAKLTRDVIEDHLH